MEEIDYKLKLPAKQTYPFHNREGQKFQSVLIYYFIAHGAIVVVVICRAGALHPCPCTTFKS